MSYKLKIKITKDILQKSMYCGINSLDEKIGQNCAIGKAIFDILPNSWVCADAILEYSNNYFPNRLPSIFLPEEARLFIEEFDNLKDKPEERLKMTPIEFEIEIPDSWLEGINIDEILTGHPVLELVNS